MKHCDVTGMRLPNKEFYARQSHCKFIDKLRSRKGFNKEQLLNYLK